MEIPFDEKGNMLAYPEGVGYRYDEVTKTYDRLPVEWREMPDFDGEMALVDYEFGRSAKRAVLEDAQGRTYPVGLVRLLDLLVMTPDTRSHVVRQDPAGRITVSGRWHFGKQGTSYLLVPVKAEAT